MKSYLFFPCIVLMLFSCSKPADMQVEKKAVMTTQTELTRQTSANSPTGPAVTDFYLDYLYTTGSGIATIHFTNNTDTLAFFTIELRSGTSLLGMRTANVSANSGIYISFQLSLTSGTLNAKVMKGSSSYTASCTIYNATTNPVNPTYKATALASTPQLSLTYYRNPVTMVKYYTPELTWTSFSNVIPTGSDYIYAAVKYPTGGGSCLYPESRSNDVKVNKISFNGVSNEIYIC
ncbi:hypothetical protein CLV59_10110 [Chitinophaga dinghuensis]|uniref:Uncharacterized protein n=1 Tax=Chitinophaga dinghuensis TaxID=1539050 RepID=A0A327WCC8_9BACT|nr:hypothetical protein [Chitinophaga dinghuensis]RAJ87261.1 hypothetical protein CLV59_10110 [Chitinophaga dinghuensis]